MLNNRFGKIFITLLLVIITSLLYSCVDFSVLQDKPTGTWATEDKTLIINFDTLNGIYVAEDEANHFITIRYPQMLDAVDFLEYYDETHRNTYFQGDYHKYDGKIILCARNDKSDIKYILYPVNELAGLVTSESSAPVGTTTSDGYSDSVIGRKTQEG